MRKYGEQKKLFISPGLLPEVPSEPVTPKVDSGESGWPCEQGQWTAGAVRLPPPPRFSAVLLSMRL